MNFGYWNRLWAEKMGDSVATVGTYLAPLRQAGLVTVPGRGSSASDIDFDAAVNTAIAICAGKSPAQGPALVQAIRKAKLRREGKTPYELTSKKELLELGAKDDTFPSVIRTLALLGPRTGSEVIKFNIQHPLAVIFHREHAIIEIMLGRMGTGLRDVDLPPTIRAEFFNDNDSVLKGLDRRPREIGRDILSRCDWWLLYLLREVLDAEPGRK